MVNDMKNLIFIGGTMGVGKTTVGQILKNKLDHSVFLDGDWCWDSSPFIVTEETKAMVIDNIAYLLNSFLDCTEYKNIIFVWVMHEQSVIDRLISMLGKKKYRLFNFSLVCSPEVLRKRLEADVAVGRRTSDIIERSIPRLPLYDMIQSTRINTDDLSAEETARQIADKVNSEHNACPCKRVKCKRHGDCIACCAHHMTKKHSPVACERRKENEKSHTEK